MKRGESLPSSTYSFDSNEMTSRNLWFWTELLIRIQHLQVGDSVLAPRAAHTWPLFFFPSAPQYSFAEQRWMEFPFYLLIVSWISLFDFSFSMEFNSDDNVKKLHWPCVYLHVCTVVIEGVNVHKYRRVAFAVIDRIQSSVCSSLPHTHTRSAEPNTEINGIKCPFRFCSLRWW